VRFAVNQMTDLIESLLEFSRTCESLRPTHGRLDEILQRAIKTARMHPEYQRIQVEMDAAGETEGGFDCPKLERVFQNLLLNACAAVDSVTGTVHISVQQQIQEVVIWIADNGRGIPEAIQSRIFAPFFSYGKESGTGLGLAVAQKNRPRSWRQAAPVEQFRAWHGICGLASDRSVHTRRSECGPLGRLVGGPVTQGGSRF
jgi:signal transduction histidine kinase